MEYIFSEIYPPNPFPHNDQSPVNIAISNIILIIFYGNMEEY